MSGIDIDLCDDYEMVAFMANETDVICSTVSDCMSCPCLYYDSDDIHHCRKAHLIKRKEELLPFYDNRIPYICDKPEPKD